MICGIRVRLRLTLVLVRGWALSVVEMCHDVAVNQVYALRKRSSVRVEDWTPETIASTSLVAASVTRLS